MMLLFIRGLVLFFGIHMLPFYPEYRVQLIEKLDSDTIDADVMYKIIFSVISLLGLIFIGVYFATAKSQQIGKLLKFNRHRSPALKKRHYKKAG